MEQDHRRCISCRKTAHRSAFWRIVRVFPSRTVQLDEGMGRSAYLCPNATCLQKAQKKNALGRSLRVPMPPEIYQALWQRLSQGTAASQESKFRVQGTNHCEE